MNIKKCAKALSRKPEKGNTFAKMTLGYGMVLTFKYVKNINTCKTRKNKIGSPNVVGWLGLPLSLLILYLGSSAVALKFFPYSLVALVSFSIIWPLPLPAPYFHDTLSPALNSGFVISFLTLCSQFQPTSSIPEMAHLYIHTVRVYTCLYRYLGR